MPKKKTESDVFKVTDEAWEGFAVEGASPGLNKRQAVFNAIVSRCLGVPCRPVTDTELNFIKTFDAGMVEAMKERGVEIRDED